MSEGWRALLGTVRLKLFAINKALSRISESDSSLSLILSFIRFVRTLGRISYDYVNKCAIVIQADQRTCSTKTDADNGSKQKQRLHSGSSLDSMQGLQQLATESAAHERPQDTFITPHAVDGGFTYINKKEGRANRARREHSATTDAAVQIPHKPHDNMLPACSSDLKCSPRTSKVDKERASATSCHAVGTAQAQEPQLPGPVQLLI